jgi:hypothetical protein
MAGVLLVTYDLNTPGQDYTSLHGELKKSNAWWHYLDSTWLIYSDETADELSARLLTHIDKNDSMLVIRVCNENQGWLNKKAWEWINNHVPAC